MDVCLLWVLCVVS